MRNEEGKTDLEKKVYRLICLRDITFRIHTLFLMSFFVVFCLLHLFLLLQYNILSFSPENGGVTGTPYLPTLNYTAF